MASRRNSTNQPAQWKSWRCAHGMVAQVALHSIARFDLAPNRQLPTILGAPTQH